MQGKAVTGSTPFAMQDSCDTRVATWFEACVCPLRNKKHSASTCKCRHMFAFAG